jgi:hypothetical protein
MVVGFIIINTMIQITNICFRVAADFSPPTAYFNATDFKPEFNPTLIKPKRAKTIFIS